MRIAGEAMVQIAKSLAPVDTGYLRDHIRYGYNSATKTLTLYSDAPWSLYQEFGTYRHRPHPFLRPALNAVAPSFLTGKITGVSTQVMIGTSLGEFHQPRQIQPHIRPHISAANRLHNIGATKRSEFKAVHMNRQGQPRTRRVGLEQKSQVILSSLSKHRLNTRKDAWN